MMPLTDQLMRQIFNDYSKHKTMKRYAIIILLILALGAFILIPILRSGGTSEHTAASLKLDGYVAVRFGESAPIPFTVGDASVTLVELIYNDSVVKSWNHPKGAYTFRLKADYYGVGARTLVLRTTFDDGSVEEENSLVRVLSDISPKLRRVTSVATFPHNTENYTQGLEFDGNTLYEGTGNPRNANGESRVGIIDLATGQYTKKNSLDATYFGEGITILGDELFQLTWQNGKCFVYDKNTLELKTKDFTYAGQGWGLCNDGKHLIMSDGSERITFRDPKTFNPVRTIEVYDDLGPRTSLNELEYIDGKIYANVYTTDIVLTIDPGTGKVLEVLDASALSPVGKMGGEVLNGIAYNRTAKKLYMTGKYWGRIMEVAIGE